MRTESSNEAAVGAYTDDPDDRRTISERVPMEVRLRCAVHHSGWVKREFYPSSRLYRGLSSWFNKDENLVIYEQIPLVAGNLYDAISANDYSAVGAMMYQYTDIAYWLFVKKASADSGNSPFHGTSLDGLIRFFSLIDSCFCFLSLSID